MRNQYPGTCYRCGRYVNKGEGHFELIRHPSFKKWQIHCAECAITNKINKGRIKNAGI